MARAWETPDFVERGMLMAQGTWDKGGGQRSVKMRLEGPADDQVGDAGHEGGAGDGEDPGDEDAFAPDPADRADALGGADAENGAGDGVRGGDGDAADFGECEDGRGGGRFRAEAADGLEARDGVAERF